MKLVSWNVNGLTRKLADPDFLDVLSEFDIIFLQETWLSPKSTLNLEIQGYCSDHLLGNKSPNTKKGRYSGGISVYYRNYLKSCINIEEKKINAVYFG